MNTHFSDAPNIKVVSAFSDLVETAFEGVVNAIEWNRKLEGDFEEIVSHLRLQEDITEISAQDLLALQLSEDGEKARAVILNDLQLLTDFGASPSLNLLKCYERDEEFDFISTDVYSWHVDRSPVGTQTFLCTYYGASSDILPNDQAEQKIAIPEIRERLRELHEGSDAEFESFLKDNYFDLHYQEKPGSKPINLGQGSLWKLAVEHPGQQVLPCIHRAPKEREGEYRLLLIC